MSKPIEHVQVQSGSAQTSDSGARPMPGSDISGINDKKPKTLRHRILGIVWDSLDKSPEDRRLVAKMDWFILTYCCLGYFVKYLDQTNVSNAYVSGMKEDLNMTGNDLNYLNTTWTVGYIIGQIPSQLIMTKVPPSIWLPALELIWSVLVIGMSGAKNVETLYVLRFFVGLLEASAYPGIMTLLGNWYLPAELGKRSAIFQVSSSVAQMIGGYIQAGLYKNMNGTNGLAAWRWLFIFDGIIGIPISLYGFFAIPNSPATTTARWLKPAEKQRAIDRMESIGRKPPRTVTLQSIKNLLKEWPFYLFTIGFAFHVLATRVYGYFNLWLKATGRYSVEEINVIPTGGYALLSVMTLVFAWTSDALQIRWPIIVVGASLSLIGTVILSQTVEPGGNAAAIMAGWFLSFLETGIAALFMAWVNEVLSYSFAHRAVVIATGDTLGYTLVAWVPLLIFDTGEAPWFHIGYKLSAGFFAIVILMVLASAWAERTWPVGKYETLDEQADCGRDGGSPATVAQV